MTLSGRRARRAPGGRDHRRKAMKKNKRTVPEPINILVTLDKNYLVVLPTMLKSLFVNNPRELFHIYLVHDALEPGDIEPVGEFCLRNLAKLVPLRVPADMFREAPVNFHYSKAMYYRLLASLLLPESLDRALYLDPDILVINPVRPLYDLDISRHLYAAAAHVGLTNLATYVNQIRLNAFESEYYYNSGVLLMNLRRQRRRTAAAEVFDYLREHGAELLLPDQDVLNALYGEYILPLDGEIYNYDCRRFDTYLLKSGGAATMDWVMRNTVFLHFCGKRKPWRANYSGRFAALYKHYRHLAERRRSVPALAG